jgi:serine-type D-Ala-D-Ala carboxypeptidase/endopeptidase (penicillin-binding protein 4)
MIYCLQKPAALLFITACCFLCNCSINKQIAQQAKILLKDSAVSTGHTGISIYDPATGKYLYGHNATQYFIPASNVKLFSLYAGMKYLGDSLVGMRYQKFSDSSINIYPSGDPTFLHFDYINQPVLDFLKAKRKSFYVNDRANINALGYGWAWDDYSDDYMVERNAFPVFGNTIKISVDTFKQIERNYSVPDWKVVPRFFLKFIPNIFLLDGKTGASRLDSSEIKKLTQQFFIKRKLANNDLNLLQTKVKFTKQEIPFVTNGVKTAVEILSDDLGINIVIGGLYDNSLYPGIPEHLEFHKIHSQPSDSLFKPMMHNSDNFFAEQTLLMTSNEYLGYMSDEKIIDTILKSSLKEVPQKPKWVDGSGLSRYNLFTPNDFVYILNKMKNDFGLQRMKVILATGGEGTLSSYYKSDAGFIYAKTGTLSNNCALSGYLYTQKGKLLIFSVLNNNYITGATPVRRSVEKFLQYIRQNF